MRLLDLHPEWMSAGGEGISNADGSPAALRKDVGVLLDCPCGKCDEDHQLYVPFENPIDGSLSRERGWARTGDTFETLTLTPSILRNTAYGGCGWHGFITNGEVITV